MAFLQSMADAVIDRSLDELLGAVLIAFVVGLGAMGLDALGRKRAFSSPTFVCVLALAASVVGMVFGAGYLRYESDQARLGAGMVRGPGPSPPPSVSDWDREGARRSAGLAWSPGFRLMLTADQGHDGRLSPEEAAELIRMADADGDGTASPREIDGLIMGRFVGGTPPAEVGRDVGPARNPVGAGRGHPSPMRMPHPGPREPGALRPR